MTDAAAVQRAFQTVIPTELPGTKLAAAVYNVAAGRSLKPFLEMKTDDLDGSLKGNA